MAKKKSKVLRELIDSEEILLRPAVQRLAQQSVACRQSGPEGEPTQAGRDPSPLNRASSARDAVRAGDCHGVSRPCTG